MTPSEQIIQTVSEVCDVSVADLKSKQRGVQKISHARQVAMHLVKLRTGMSYPQVGRIFGGRDHTTVMHGVRVVKRDISKKTGRFETYLRCEEQTRCVVRPAFIRREHFEFRSVRGNIALQTAP